MLEKTVGTIKNRKPRDTDNNGNTIHKTKTNKANKHNFTTRNFWFSSFVM